VADYLGTKHHTFTFSIQEALDGKFHMALKGFE
jgi:hypothetical protein